MYERILEKLYQPFELRERRGVGNKTFKYVPSEDIVDRMNKVFQGSWSTEVRTVDVIEDQVLMCVRVYINDGSRECWHDGYASHPLARYTSGPNNGKIIDVGNSYKSAMSKAIKTAVSKWGVALYLEEDTNQPSSMNVPLATPVVQSVDNTSAPDVPVVPNQNTVSTLNVSGPTIEGPPVNSPPVNTGPPVINQPPVNDPGKPSQFQPPVFTVENTEVPVSKAETFDIPDSGNGNSENLTSVQKVAIETLMSMNNLTFEDVLQQALNRSDNLPATLDDVSYLDAVTIIQYGNNLRQI